MRCTVDAGGGEATDAAGQDVSEAEVTALDADDPDGELDVPQADAPEGDAPPEIDAPATDGSDSGEGEMPGAAPCPSGTYCVDGYCCDAECQGPCRACDLPSSLGMCTVVPRGVERINCRDSMACDGSGGCKKKNGQMCVDKSECLTGFCVDGVCCNSGCTSICQTCVKEGSAGTCSPLPDGIPDEGSTPPCKAPGTCNGAGGCRQGMGGRCATANDCLSKSCVDGVCCDSACAQECMACNVSGMAGTCSPVASGGNDAPSCPWPDACDGSGHCRRGFGAPCTNSLGCTSDVCCGPPGQPTTCRSSSVGCECGADPTVCQGSFSICCGRPGQPKTCQSVSMGCDCTDDARICQGSYDVCCGQTGMPRTCRNVSMGCDCADDATVCRGSYGFCCGEPGVGKTCRSNPDGCDCSQDTAVCGSRTCCASGPRMGTCQPGQGFCN